MIRLRRDTAANWTAANPVLGAGQMGVETDTRNSKFGDGATAWNALPYFTQPGGGGSVTSTELSAVSAAAAAAINVVSAAVNVVSNALSAEIVNRVSGDNALSNVISALAVDSLVDVSAPAPTDQQALVWKSASAQWVASTVAAGAGSVTSTELSAVSAAAAQAISVVSAQVVTNSAQMTSADNALSAAINVVSNAVSVLSGVVVGNSAQMNSADNAISAAAAAVSVRVDSVMTVVSNQGSAIVANSAQMTSADNALSAAINVVSNAASDALSVANAVSNRLSTWTLDNLANVSAPAPTDGQVLAFNSAQAQWVASTMTAGAGSVTSTELSAVSAAAAQAISVVSAQVVTNSAQMTSADNAISAAAAAVSARVDSVMTVVSNQGSAIVANSAQMTSADNALSAAINVVSNAASDALSVANAVSNRLSTWTLDNLANVSVPAPADGQVLAFNSAQAQWVASTMAAGVGSVTSTELSAVSAAAASADATLSARINSVMTVVSNQGSAIVANSAQMTSADNAISAAAANALSVANAASNAVSVLSSQALVVSAAPTDGQVLMFKSASAQWVASTVGAGELPAKRVLADDQIVSAIAPVSVSGFTFTCSAGVGYKFEFGLYTSTPISLAGNKWVLSVPSSAPIVAIFQQGGAAGGVSTLNTDRTNVTMANVTVSAVGVPIACFIRGTFRCSANGGTMNLRVGNNVSGGAAGSSITLIAGSYGFVWRMV